MPHPPAAAPPETPPWLRGERPPQLVHLARLAARAPEHGELRHPLPPELWERLPSPRLWRHQAEAIDLLRAGHHTVVATGTASGKSLCYQVPLLEAACAPDRGTALLVFPTKALAHDQLRALGALDVPGLVAGAYDGDTGEELRRWLRTNADVVLTNPEMLHHGILPAHHRWAGFLSRLRYVVVDELHLLRGIFGSHVAHVLRRLRRLAARYGASPTFAFASATLGAPAAHASALSGVAVQAVVADGSPRGERAFALWNPQAASPQARSCHQEAAELTAQLTASGRRTIAFCRSRRATEVVAAQLRRRLPPELASRVRSYRGGYLPEERRAIEEDLAAGRVAAVVATTALELGVDIGGLDACVLAGFPGTISSMWQQTGRAGRGEGSAITVLVAGEDQLDHWYVQHPGELFGRGPEPAVINPANPFVLGPQLACAAHEQPIGHSDAAWWPEDLDEGVLDLARRDQVRIRVRDLRGGPVAVWSGRGRPATTVGLRSGGARQVAIVGSDDQLVGTVDESRAPSLVHPGAIYLHQGTPYRVRSLDLEALVATVEPTGDGEHTRPTRETALAVLSVEGDRDAGAYRVCLGDVEVTTRVTGFRRIETLTGETLESVQLDLPPAGLATRAFWYAISPGALQRARITPAEAAGTLHAVEHAAIGLLPLVTICDRWDVGGLATPAHPDTGTPTIFVHDAHPGGAGIAELAAEVAEAHLHAVLELVRSCRCEAGCPSCVQSPKCGNGNEPLDKAGAERLLTELTAPSARTHSTRAVASARTVTSPASAPTTGTVVGAR